MRLYVRPLIFAPAGAAWTGDGGAATDAAVGPDAAETLAFASEGEALALLADLEPPLQTLP